MRKILLIVWKDLRQRIRNPVGVLLMMAIPLVITLIIGVVFGGSDEMKLPRNAGPGAKKKPPDEAGGFGDSGRIPDGQGNFEVNR